jgi:hypothetical protein
MKSWFRIPLAMIAGAFLLASCSMPYYPPTPQSETSEEPSALGTPHPMEMIEVYATGTAVARTEMANPANAPIAQTATAFALTRQALPMALVIIMPDGSRHGFTYSEIEAYAALTLDLFDAPRKAVDLRFLLEEVKWSHFPLFSITIEGRNSMTFHIDRLPHDAALYLDNGTVNFVSGEIPVDDWPRDIVLVIVR